MVNLYRDLHVLEHIENHTLSLLHGVPQAWRAHPGGVAVADAPTRFGCRVSVAHTPRRVPDGGGTRERVELSLRCPAGTPAGDTPAVVRVHVGPAAALTAARASQAEAATPGLAVERSGEGGGAVLVFRRQAAWSGARVSVDL